MLVKVEDGFYLNSQHIIAVRISKKRQDDAFIITVEYSPNSTQNAGLFEKKFYNGVDAEVYLQNLHQMISKA